MRSTEHQDTAIAVQQTEPPNQPSIAQLVAEIKQQIRPISKSDKGKSEKSEYNHRRENDIVAYVGDLTSSRGVTFLAEQVAESKTADGWLVKMRYTWCGPAGDQQLCAEMSGLAKDLATAQQQAYRQALGQSLCIPLDLDEEAHRPSPRVKGRTDIPRTKRRSKPIMHPSRTIVVPTESQVTGPINLPRINAEMRLLSMDELPWTVDARTARKRLLEYVRDLLGQSDQDEAEPAVDPKQVCQQVWANVFGEVHSAEPAMRDAYEEACKQAEQLVKQALNLPEIPEIPKMPEQGPDDPF